jgi:sugar phosphate isomerase/epimerase
LARLKRIVAYAESVGALLLLENLNFEPDDAEVHYLAHTVEECRVYFDAITSKNFGMAFTINHANLVPDGIGGFLDAFGVDRIGEVRLADNNGDKEVHLNPGEGNIDFPAVFSRLEDSGYQGHYAMAFGSLDDRIKARDAFANYAG